VICWSPTQSTPRPFWWNTRRVSVAGKREVSDEVHVSARRCSSVVRIVSEPPGIRSSSIDGIADVRKPAVQTVWCRRLHRHQVICGQSVCRETCVSRGYACRRIEERQVRSDGSSAIFPRAEKTLRNRRSRRLPVLAQAVSRLSTDQWIRQQRRDLKRSAAESLRANLQHVAKFLIEHKDTSKRLVAQSRLLLAPPARK
jgi:hypothetical protein